MPIPTDSTLLVMDGVGISPYSARGLSQTLAPIDASVHIERTINGALIDFGYEPMRKYKSTIKGSDQRPPILDGIWPGTTVVIECIATLGNLDYLPFGREPVDYGDALVYESGCVFYRPRLTMLVTGFDSDEDEYGATVGWQMTFEEV